MHKFWNVGFALALCAALSTLHPAPSPAQTGPAGAVDKSGETAPGEIGRNPIAVAAYGQLFDANMGRIEATPEFLRGALQTYTERLMASADDSIREQYADHAKALKEALGFDELSQQFLLLEWLTEAIAPRDKAYIHAANRTMRIIWFKKLLGDERYYAVVDKASGLPVEILKHGEQRAMMRKATSATGKDYIEECRKAGVPIPPQWGDEGQDAWNHVGDLTTNFLGSGNPASVYRFDSDAPAGLCVALPRINGKTINLLGIICLGRETSNACFYDNMGVPVGEKVPIEDFLSGGNLTDVCSDCHAGENPYVVHPSGPLNMSPDNKPAQWYTPLVKPTWPQNPGPFALLGQVPINPLAPDEDQSCLGCHYQGDAGRFPDVLALNAIQGGLSGYCSIVLASAIGNTMPGDDGMPGDEGPYDIHVNAMKAFCSQSTPPGGEVPPPDTKDDPEVLGPPIVIGPLYACAEAVEVSGAPYGSKLTVTVAGAPQPAVTVTSPSQTLVAVPPLVAGTFVGAFYEVAGVASDDAIPKPVIDHTVAYPNGLPAPTVDPTLIYQCGRTIAVRHVRGAKVTVLTNGGDDVTYTSGSDWSNLPPKIRPFVLGDKYSARQQMCTDKSGESAAHPAVTGPSPFPTPTIDPSPPIVGQQLIGLYDLANGALTVVSESAAGDISSFSTAVDWNPEVDIATGLGHPLQAGEQLAVVSELCEAGKISFPEARPCKELPAPAIAQPLVGDTAVHVTSAVPGAQILVYDAALAEIGDGSGALVGLTRAVVNGDILTVIQKLDKCTSAKAYQVEAVCASIKDCG